MSAISMEHGFVFLHPLKTAGTSIELALSRILKSPDYVTAVEDSFESEQLKEMRTGIGRHSDLSHILAAVGKRVEELDIAITVRHPQATLESLWRYSIRELESGCGYLGVPIRDLARFSADPANLGVWPFAFAPVRHLACVLERRDVRSQWLHAVLTDEEVLNALVPSRLLSPLPAASLSSKRVHILRQESLDQDWSKFLKKYMPGNNPKIGSFNVTNSGQGQSAFSSDWNVPMLNMIADIFQTEIDVVGYEIG